MAEVGRNPHAGSATSRAAGQSNGAERIVFWQTHLLPHQWAFLQALSLEQRREITLVTTAATESEARAAIGWKNLEEARIFLLARPDLAAIDRLLEIRPQTSLHIFVGDPTDQSLAGFVQHAAKKNARLALMGESPADHNRLAQYQSLRNALGEKVEHVFPIGKQSHEFFRQVGFPESKVHPWGLFPETPASLPGRPVANSVFQIVYLGSMTAAKAPDVLFEALKAIRGKRWKLVCLGEGHLEAQCYAIAQKHGVLPQIEFKPSLKEEEALTILSHADLAVVPSRHESWSPVMNQALMRGIPVVCTDKCGSADLVADPLRGTIVPAGDPNALGQALEHWVTIGPLNVARRLNLAKWSKKITPETAAQRFCESLSASTNLLAAA